MFLLPVDVTELVLAQTTPEADSDIKGSAGRDSATDTGHGHHRDILKLDIGSRLGNEHETLVQEVKRALVGLDRALDTVVSVVADKVLGRHDNLLARQPTEDLGHDLVNGLLIVCLKLITILLFQQFPVTASAI